MTGKDVNRLSSILLAVLAGLGFTAASAQAPRPTVTDGTVHVPAFDLPPSTLASPEAIAGLKARGSIHGLDDLAKLPIEQNRAIMERIIAPAVAEANRRYAVDVVEQQMGGVRTRVVTPKGGEADRNRVLINLHGGAFMACAENCALAESIPVAAVGRYRVVTVDYRQGPENVFPAASEDVASVYQDLLKSYRPENIGIYGCSAGGALTAQAVAWFADKKIAMPGAVGIFGAGAVPFGRGDSAYVAAYVDGMFPPPAADGSVFPLPYFRGARLDDPLVSPGVDPALLAKFPPTLLITGTRAMDLSPAVATHSRLLKAGVRSQLIVGEGMGHCYIYQSQLPEARDAYDQIVKFFDENLGRRPGPHPATPRAPAPEHAVEWKRVDPCLEKTNARTKAPGADGKMWTRARKTRC